MQTLQPARRLSIQPVLTHNTSAHPPARTGGWQGRQCAGVEEVGTCIGLQPPALQLPPPVLCSGHELLGRSPDLPVYGPQEAWMGLVLM